MRFRSECNGRRPILSKDGLVKFHGPIATSLAWVLVSDWDGKLPWREAVVNNMAELSVSAQLRSGGRQGSVIADELIAFGAAGKTQAM
jgi:hypothetical protein